MKHLNEILDKLLSSQKFLIRNLSKDASASAPGVYIIYTPDANEVVYAGITGNIRSRMFQHLDSGTPSDLAGNLRIATGKYPSNKNDYLVQYLVVHEDRERMFLEHFLIAIFTPAFNKV